MITPIPGLTTAARVDEHVRHIELTDAEMAEIDAIDPGTLRGQAGEAPCPGPLGRLLIAGPEEDITLSVCLVSVMP